MTITKQFEKQFPNRKPEKIFPALDQSRNEDMRNGTIIGKNRARHPAPGTSGIMILECLWLYHLCPSVEPINNMIDSKCPFLHTKTSKNIFSGQTRLSLNSPMLYLFRRNFDQDGKEVLEAPQGIMMDEPWKAIKIWVMSHLTPLAGTTAGKSGGAKGATPSGAEGGGPLDVGDDVDDVEL